MRAWILISFVVAAVCSYAQSTGPFCSVPAGGAPMPHYFYSTNNHISGNAMVGPPDERGPRYFVYACLKVGGNIVDEYIHILGEPQPMSIGGAATFDSTVFGNGTQLVVRFEVVDSYGVVYEAQDSAPVKNKIGLAQVDEWNGFVIWDAIQQTREAFDNLGWEIVELSHGSWDPSDLSVTFGGSGLYHISTHGFPDRHLSDSWDDVFPNMPPFPSYSIWREQFNGVGYPPHNWTFMPPVTMAFLDCCWTGETDAFWWMLWPWRTTYSEMPENMCLLTYNGSIAISYHPWAARRIFGRMREGDTAGLAREYFLDKNEQAFDAQQYGEVVFVVRSLNPTTWDAVRSSDMPLYGDPYTRLRWVYTGTHELAEEIWYR